MTINYHVTGSERKRMVKALGELTFSDPVYAGAPTFAYQVGDYTVDKNGVISYPETVAQEAVMLLVERLGEHGFTPEQDAEDAPAPVAAETPDVAPEPGEDAEPAEAETEATQGAETPDMAAEPAEEDAPDDVAAESAGTEYDPEDDAHLTITIPKAKLPDDALSRLRQIVANKEELFKRAMSADALPIEVTEEEVSFPWFTLTGVEGEAAAYAQFITALCQMAREQTRILDKPYDGDNDRFAMRIFMVRLGMKGTQFALARKLMMKNLSGNSGWRYGAPPKKADATADSNEPTSEPEAPSAEENSPEGGEAPTTEAAPEHYTVEETENADV